MSDAIKQSAVKQSAVKQSVVEGLRGRGYGARDMSWLNESLVLKPSYVMMLFEGDGVTLLNGEVVTRPGVPGCRSVEAGRFRYADPLFPQNLLAAADRVLAERGTA
jgi:hypothetical protein